MNSTERVRVVAGLTMAGAATVVATLFVLMVGQNDRWTRRSQENRWAFRSVPSMRGAIYDRAGTRLAWDEPATEIGVHYRRFRMYQPVGAAVHLGNFLQRHFGDGLEYTYLGESLGPEAALAVVLAFPVAVLKSPKLDKGEFNELSTALTTVLAPATGRTRKETFATLRKAARERGATAIGDVFDDVPRAAIAAAFARSFAVLRELDAELLVAMGGQAQRRPGLLECLDAQRAAALLEQEPQQGTTLPQDRLQVVCDGVPFELAAAVRLQSEQLAGIRVQPTFVRRTAVPPESSLAAWVGTVADIDRSLAPLATGIADGDDEEVQRAKRQAAEQRRREQMLGEYAPGDGWAGQVVPAEFGDVEVDRGAFVEAAEATLYRTLLTGERRGLDGLEGRLDRQLRGSIGMRFVERDKTRSEQQLFGHLEVEAGDDVRLTIDARLQRLVEAHVERQYETMRFLHLDPNDQRKVAAAMAMIDVATGDILAYGAVQQQLVKDPETGEKRPITVRAPGVPYDGNSSLGSVVKPFVLVEHLQAEALGAPHQPTATMKPCEGKWEFLDRRRLGCLAAHGEAGRDPVHAIAQSCNTFFFQAAMGFGEAGLHRAYARFGLVDDAGGPFVACRQNVVEGLPGWRSARPRMDDASAVLPMRGIGYGVYALPTDVARAYAALATGYLPTLGVIAGQSRPIVPLDDLAAELAVVRQGLAACLATGTARKIRFPQGMTVLGKTGTAEIGTKDKQNNAWFAGYVESAGGTPRVAFAAVLYWVPHGVHGGDYA
ncbi:MAG: hypothetical protein RL398_309, partial [Planctomycetota bacterium]